MAVTVLGALVARSMPSTNAVPTFMDARRGRRLDVRAVAFDDVGWPGQDAVAREIHGRRHRRSPCEDQTPGRLDRPSQTPVPCMGRAYAFTNDNATECLARLFADQFDCRRGPHAGPPAARPEHRAAPAVVLVAGGGGLLGGLRLVPIQRRVVRVPCAPPPYQVSFGASASGAPVRRRSTRSGLAMNGRPKRSGRPVLAPRLHGELQVVAVVGHVQAAEGAAQRAGS